MVKIKNKKACSVLLYFVNPLFRILMELIVMILSLHIYRYLSEEETNVDCLLW